MSFAPIEAVAGDNTLVDAVPGKRIRVLALAIVAGTATTLLFQSGAGVGATALSGGEQFAAKQVEVLPHNPNGWFETLPGEVLNLNLGIAETAAGHLAYMLI